MNTYYVMWTYMGNYCTNSFKIEACSEEDAVYQFCKNSIYGLEFRKKAHFTVTKDKPVKIRYKDAFGFEKID